MAKSTKTSSFGNSNRINHDAANFYNSKLYSSIKGNAKKARHNEHAIPKKDLNTIYCKSSEDMSELPNNSIHLVITSPPYNVKKEYDDDLTLDEYLNMLYNVFSQTYNKLATGGRACINIANIGRKPYIPMHSHIIQIMSEIGFLMRGEIIWNKSASAGVSCAWGSWMSASNPVLRDVHEYILIFSKDSYKRNKNNKENSIKKEEFMEFTKSVWTFPTVSAKKIGHPAPFPKELPYRLIQLYSFEDDIILDPFCGSGQTCIAALENNRNYIGYDINQDYVDLANNRIKEAKCQTKLI